jgi:hypothetical protein
MTVFNMIHANDLQRALDLISRMIDSGYVGQCNNGNQVAASQEPDEPLILQSSLPNRPDLGLCVTLVRGPDNMPKCFSVTLVKNESSSSASGNGNVAAPFNPALPTIPSMPIESKPAKVNAIPQATLQQPTVTATAGIPGANLSPTALAIPQASVLQAAVPQATIPHAVIPQAAIPQASAVPQASAANPQSQLIQLLLLQQMQQQPVVQQPVVQQQAQLQYQQQLSQLNQAPTQLPVANGTVPFIPATGPGISGYWNTQNFAMLPQIQQILNPSGSNSSSQGSIREEREDAGLGLNQNQPAVQPAIPMAAPNLPMLSQIQGMLKPPDSSIGSLQGSKENSGDERDDSRPWYYAG